MRDLPPDHDLSSFQGPILLTGTPYSGTTWMGRQLQDACSLAYFQEPWNPYSGLVGYDRPFRRHHEYINERNADDYLGGLRRMAAMRPRIHWRNLLDNRRLLMRELAEFRTRAGDRRAQRRPLWKDPIALLSSAWIARTFDSPVLLMVRHPVSFVTSAIAREGAQGRSGLGWLIDDREFMRIYGHEFRDDLVRLDLPKTSPVERWSLVWRLLMTIALRELEPMSSQVVVVRYEDCLEHPIPSLIQIAGSLGLPLVTDPAEVVARHRDRHAHSRATRRFDPAEEMNRREQTMDPPEQALVRSIVEPMSSIWYGARKGTPDASVFASALHAV